MKISINGNTISLTQLLSQHNVEENDQISVNSSLEFESTLNQKLWVLRNELRNMLPTKPNPPTEPSTTTREWIPFESPSSIWIDDDRPESEQYRTVEKSREQYDEEMEKYRKELRVYQTLSEDYEKKLQLIQNDPLFIEKQQKQETLQRVSEAYRSSIKIPEWHEVKAKLEEAINTSETSRGGKNRLLDTIQAIDNNGQSPERKVEQAIDYMLQEYRHILRSGMTGVFSKETGSGLAEKLQTFSRETLGIELPRSLGKGEPLTVESLHRGGHINNNLYEGMTSKSPGDKYEVQQGFNIGLGYGSDQDL